MTNKDGHVEINMSGVPVEGIGGLGLVAMVAVMVVLFPWASWFTLFGAIGGILLSVALVFIRRFHTSSGPSGSDPTILLRPESVDNPLAVPGSGSHRTGVNELVAAPLA